MSKKWKKLKKIAAPVRHINYAKKALGMVKGGDEGGEDARSQAAGQMVRKNVTRQGGSGSFTYGEDVYE